MRRAMAKTFGWTIALGLATILAAPIALARAETQTIRFSGVTESSTSANPCTGDPGTLTETVRQGVEHLTANPDGTYHRVFTIRTDILFTPDDPSRPSLTGTSTYSFEANVNTENSTLTSAFSGKAIGSDGSSVTLWGVVHATVIPDGTVTVAFEVGSVRCA